MKKLQLAKDLALPVDVAGQAVALVGIRGSGKTNTAGVIAEELLEQRQQIVVIDPTDAWWGLRSQFPVFIFGGPHGDLGLEEADGKTLAEFVVEEQVPIILSLRHLRKGAQRRLVTEFCEELYHLKGRPEYRTALTVFIDEAPQFVPQRVTGDMARLVGAVQDMILLGRSAGFGVVMISQRFATLNADVRTQADTIVVHRLPSPLDRKALSEWIEENASIAEQKEVLQSLATLKTGQAWVWAPYFDLFQQTQIRPRRTFDSSAAPKRGVAVTPPKDLAKVDLEQLKSKMAAAVEKARAEDPKELKKKIAELEKGAIGPDIVKCPSCGKPPRTPGRILPYSCPHCRTGVLKWVGINESTATEKQVPALTDADRKLIEKLADGLRLRLEDAGSQMRTLQARLQVAVTDAVHDYFNDNLDVARKATADVEAVLEKPSVKKLLEKLNALAVSPAATNVKSGANYSKIIPATPQVPQHQRVAASPKASRPAAPALSQNSDITPVQQKILNALAELEQLGSTQPDRELVAFLSGYSHLNSKGFTNGIGALRSAGYIDYPAQGVIVLTDSGRAIAQPPPAPRSPADVHERIIALLGGASGKILRPLIDAYPNAMARADVAKAAGYEHLNSKGFTNAIGRLRTLGFIDYPQPGAIVAKPVLFLEG